MGSAHCWVADIRHQVTKELVRIDMGYLPSVFTWLWWNDPSVCSYPGAPTAMCVGSYCGCLASWGCHQFYICRQVLRHPLLLYVTHGPEGVHTNATMYTVSSYWYVAALYISVPCWKCSMSLVHSGAKLVGEIWHVWNVDTKGLLAGQNN